MKEGMHVDPSIEIHPNAVVDPKAELAAGVLIGPGAVIGPDVVVGANTWIGPNAVLEGRLTLGRDNKVFPGACLGLEPQDLKMNGKTTLQNTAYLCAVPRLQGTFLSSQTLLAGSAQSGNHE